MAIGEPRYARATEKSSKSCVFRSGIRTRSATYDSAQTAYVGAHANATNVRVSELWNLHAGGVLHRARGRRVRDTRFRAGSAHCTGSTRYGLRFERKTRTKTVMLEALSVDGRRGDLHPPLTRAERFLGAMNVMASPRSPEGSVALAELIVEEGRDVVVLRGLMPSRGHPVLAIDARTARFAPCNGVFSTGVRIIRHDGDCVVFWTRDSERLLRLLVDRCANPDRRPLGV